MTYQIWKTMFIQFKMTFSIENDLNDFLCKHNPKSIKFCVSQLGITVE